MSPKMTPSELADWGRNHRMTRFSGREIRNGDNSPWHLVIRAKRVVGDGESPEMRELLAAVRATGPCRVTLHSKKGEALTVWMDAGCPR